MAITLILFSTTDGHTLRICQRLATTIESQGQSAEIHAIEGAARLDLGAYDKIVIGASIRYGRHSRAVERFVAANAEVLAVKRNAFFSVSAVARKPGKDTAAGNPYVRRFLRRVPWQPQHVAVFAGRIDYPSYRLLDRLVIRGIMWLTHGPTDSTRSHEFTDWQQVERFGRRIAGL